MKKNKLCFISLFVALLVVGCVQPASHDQSSTEKVIGNVVSVNVMNAPYGAVGDGITSDRRAIQKAIDDVFDAGGGTVYLPSGYTFLSGNLILKSNVNLCICEGAVLKQNPDVHDYIEVIGYDYGEGFVNIGEPYIPWTGDLDHLGYPGDPTYPTEDFENHKPTFFWNYPYIYAGKGTNNIKITGKGKIEMMEHTEGCKNTIHLHVLGFYACNNIELSDFTLNYTAGMAGMAIMCNNGLIRNVTMNSTSYRKYILGEEILNTCTCGDGFGLDRCQYWLIKDSNFNAGDDAFKIGTCYGDVRKDRWASSTVTQPSKYIELDHVSCPWQFKGLAFFTIGIHCPVLSEVEISDIYVHDSYFCSVGVWSNHSMWGGGQWGSHESYMYSDLDTPLKNFRWERNVYHSGVSSLAAYPVSEQYSDDGSLKSMAKIYNGDFEYSQLGYWNKVTENGSKVMLDDYEGNHFGHIGSLDKGISKLYQGISIPKGKHTLSALVRASYGANAKLFVRDQNDVLIAEKYITSEDWELLTLDFVLESNANYRIGIENERGSLIDSFADIDNMVLQ